MGDQLMNEATRQAITQAIGQDKVVLFMKGTPDFPQCGFSGKVVYMLRQCQAKFAAHNVLENFELREGIKEYSEWPTIPQLYINNEFVGGCDIVTELYESGELKNLLAV